MCSSHVGVVATPTPAVLPQSRPAEAAVGAAAPHLAALTGALRSPLLPVIGFAELLAMSSPPGPSRDYAAEVVTGSRQLLSVLDLLLVLAAGQPVPPGADAFALAAAEDALRALRGLLARPEAPCAAMDSGGVQRLVA